MLAWSSTINNKIRVVGFETGEEVAAFDGVKLKEMNRNFLSSFYWKIYFILKNKEQKHSWTHVRELSNTGYLVSAHHCHDTSANLEVFSVSQSKKFKKVYSFEEVSGGNIVIISLTIHSYLSL